MDTLPDIDYKRVLRDVREARTSARLTAKPYCNFLRSGGARFWVSDEGGDYLITPDDNVRWDGTKKHFESLMQTVLGLTNVYEIGFQGYFTGAKSLKNLNDPFADNDAEITEWNVVIWVLPNPA